MNKLLTSAALLGVMAISATVANAAHADAGKVKCLGIAKAGKNYERYSLLRWSD
jgi:uncharacterized membrane protein